jgi:hypothetical protein
MVSPGSIVSTGGRSREKCPCSVRSSGSSVWIIVAGTVPRARAGVDPLRLHSSGKTTLYRDPFLEIRTRIRRGRHAIVLLFDERGAQASRHDEAR